MLEEWKNGGWKKFLQWILAGKTGTIIWIRRRYIPNRHRKQRYIQSKDKSDSHYQAFKTFDDLIDNYIMHDGTPLREALYMKMRMLKVL